MYRNEHQRKKRVFDFDFVEIIWYRDRCKIIEEKPKIYLESHEHNSIKGISYEHN